MLSRPPCRDRDVQSLANWIENTACLATEETAYLSSKEDLLALGSGGNTNDPATSALESPIEDGLIGLKKWTGKVSVQVVHDE